MAQRLIKRRNGVRLNANKEKEKLKGYLREELSDKLVEAETSIAKLSDYRARLQEMDKDILDNLADDDDDDAEIATASRVDDELLDVIQTAKARIAALQRTAASQAAADTSMVDRGNSTAVKLPKFDLPKFDGDPLHWQEFWDCFKCTIDEQDSLPAVSKLKYLKGSLEGSALRLAEGYRLTEANYREVVTALQERFGNPQLAIFSHLSAMLEIAPAANHEVSQLQSVYDNCERHIRSLVALGLAEDTFGQVFTPMILSKLPMFVKMELHRKNGDQPWTLGNLRSLLKEELRVRDMSERQFGRMQLQDRKSKSGSNKPKEQHVPFARSSASVLSSGPARKGLKGACPFCGNAHSAENCQKYVTVRARKIRLRGRCYTCLQEGHSVADCKDAPGCRRCGKRDHHTSLCLGNAKARQDGAGVGIRGNAGSSAGQVMNPDAASFVPANALSFNAIPRRDANLQTAVADVCNSTGGPFVSARLLFDTAGFRSYITSDLAKEIAAKTVDRDALGLAVFGAARRKYQDYEVVQFDVKTQDSELTRVVANVTNRITLPIVSQSVDFEAHPSLSKLTFAEPILEKGQLLPVDVLIGADYYYDFVTNELLKFGDGLVVVSSTLGYMLSGGVASRSRNDQVGSVLLSPHVTADPNYDLEQFWKLESVGITDPPEAPGDEQALKQFLESVEFRGGRYYVRWPWKMEHPELPDNYALALGRLRSLLRQLKKQPELLEKYSGVIAEQLSLGIIEHAPNVPTGPLVHYVPHHCVVKPDRATTKVRVVFDASAKTRASELCLNDCIHRGPILMNDLVGVLLRFRTVNVAMIADVEKAFLQIMLHDSERDVTRFLWLKDVQKPASAANVVAFRFQRVLFGNVASPFLLGATLHHHLSQYSDPIAETLQRDHYVDNVVTGASNVESARVFYTTSKAMFHDMSMNLREWFSNSADFLASVPPNDRGKPDPKLKVLGVSWNTTSDKLSCNVEFVDHIQPTTKREVLQAVAKVFDPLGWYTPVTMVVKMLLQETWKRQYGWDDVLPEEVLELYQGFHSSLSGMQQHAIPRLVVGMTDVSSCQMQLHCFVDASTKGYAAVVYFRRESYDTTESVRVGLMVAKGRVSPVKQLSVPKLELMAAVVGAKLVDFVRKQVPVEFAKVFLWSDSQCVLHWIAGSRIQTTFVRNRLQQIRNVSGVTYRYVPSKDNPADVASRGATFQELVSYIPWWSGPDFLFRSESDWPDADLRLSISANPEEDCNSLTEVQAPVLAAPAVEDVLQVAKFSSARKLHRVLGWCIRFVANCRKSLADRRRGPLTATEIRAAREKMLKAVQLQAFASLLSPSATPRDKLLVRQLQLFRGSDELIRSTGRLQGSELMDDARHPVVMPKGHPYTRLLILEAHERSFHAGVPHTLAKLRENVWVIHGRSQVKKALRECRVCRIVKAKPFQAPQFPPLPDYRVQGSTAFDVVGLDYLGPLLVKSRGVDVKVWVCLFTCAAVRAIHLEVVTDLTAEQFLLALRRFGSLYDYPRLIVSDNAKTFTAAKACLGRVWRTDKVQEFASDQGISWKFITERAPWMGGFYERLVGLTKNALRSCLRQRKVDTVELMTICYEIAATLNCRPLLYVEVNDPTTLCPANFLLKGCRRQQSQPDQDEGSTDADFRPDVLMSKWRRIQAILQGFWQIWSKQYLLSLREYFVQKKVRGCSEIAPAEGMSVIVRSEAPRGQWKIGRIEKLEKSEDGLIRSATVRVPNGLIHRPIKLLCPLEASVAAPEVNAGQVPDDNGGPRPTRQAARAARGQIQRQLAGESDDE